MNLLATTLVALLLGPAETPEPDIKALVRQLGSPRYMEREKASARLKQIGSAALRDLIGALASNDAEIRKRARRLLRSLQTNSLRELKSFSGHIGSVNGVAFSPDSKFAASVDSRAVRLWDLTTGKMIKKTEQHDDRVMCVAFSPDGKLLATGSEDRSARLWEVPSLKQKYELEGHDEYVRSVAFSKDGKKLLSAGLDGRMILWDVTTGKEQRRVEVKGQKFLGAALHPNAFTAIGVGQPKKASRWSTRGRRRGDRNGSFTIPLAHDKTVMAIQMTADSKHVLTGGLDKKLCLWSLVSPYRSVWTVTHPAEVTCIAVSRDGTRTVAGDYSGELRLWDVKTGYLLGRSAIKGKQVWSVAYSPDGKSVLSGGQDGVMRLWRVE